MAKDNYANVGKTRDRAVASCFPLSPEAISVKCGMKKPLPLGKKFCRLRNVKRKLVSVPISSLDSVVMLDWLPVRCAWYCGLSRGGASIEFWHEV